MQTPDNISLDRALAHLQALNRLAQIISSTLEPDDMLKNILKEAMTLTGAGQGVILSLQSERTSQMHTLFRSNGAAAGQLNSAFSELVGGWVIKNRTYLQIADFTQDTRFQIAKKWFPDIKAVLATPMQLQDHITGIIILTRDESFHRNEVELMAIVAAQCAQLMENARHFQRVVQENRVLRREVERRYQFHEIIGNSPAMQRIFDLLERIIPGDSRVLLAGESGTGKEMIARVIHYNGARKDHKFVAVDCGALPENLLESEFFGHVKGAFTGAIRDKTGLFELANKGTLFLDEIANTNLVFQAKLLRAIQEGEIRPVGSETVRKVDVRIIAATSSHLREKVANGEFREDLFYRLNVINLQLPPLRERREDIPLLANYFLQKYAAQTQKNCRGFAPETIRMLERHPWPGNVRELENVIERALALALPSDAFIAPDLLPETISGQAGASLTSPEVATDGNLVQAVKIIEKQMISEALQQHGGNRTTASQALGITRQTLISKIKKYGLNHL